MRGSGTAIAFVVLTVALQFQPARAQPIDVGRELEEAKALYREAKFAQAIAKLQATIGRLEQLRDLQARRIQLSDAHLHLALSYVALNDPTAAKESLKQMLRADRSRKLDPDVYAPKVIELFEEARADVATEPASATAASGPSRPAAAETKKGGSKTPLIILGAGAVAAGGFALAKGGGASTTLAPSPVPTVAPGQNDIVFQGSVPGPGASISRSRGDLITLTFVVVSTIDRSFVSLHVELGHAGCPPLTGCNCWIGVFEPMSLTAGQARTVQVTVSAEPAAGRNCPIPSSTIGMGARMLTGPAGAGLGQFFVKMFDVNYRVVP